MKKSFITVFPFIICMALMAFQCESDPTTPKENEQKELSVAKKTIEDLVASSICNESTECKFIAFGSKPCGGPWGYLVYSTSIDIEKLENLVEDYNKKEAVFNQKWDIASDCAFALPPTSVICENNTCVPVY